MLVTALAYIEYTIHIFLAASLVSTLQHGITSHQKQPPCQTSFVGLLFCLDFLTLKYSQYILHGWLTISNSFD